MTNFVLNSTLSYANVKGAYKSEAMKAELLKAFQNAIIDGNIRAFDETYPKLKGTDKAGNYLNNLQGFILSGLKSAQKQARTIFEQLHANGDKLNKRLTQADKDSAYSQAESMVLSFVDNLTKSENALKEARQAASDKTKATKLANEKAEAEKAQKAEAEKAEAEKARQADSITITALLSGIKEGKKEALSLASLISEALQAHEAEKAEKARLKAEKTQLKAQQASEKQASDKARFARNKKLNDEAYALQA